MLWRAERDVERIGFRVGTAAYALEDNTADLSMKADSAFGSLEDVLEAHKFQLPQHERDTFNDKFIFILLLVVGMPCVSSLLISTSPALTYWIGMGGAITGVACFLWMLVGHQILLRGAVHRRLGVINMLVIPILALIVVNNFHKVTSLDVHTQLSMQDCVTFPRKLRLENAWQDASALLDRCLLEETRLTGSSMEELQRVDGVQRCPGYAEGRKLWPKEWDYLQQLEAEEHCAGWCESRRPLWHAEPPDALRRPDRCSLVVARAMKTQIYRTSNQIIFYSMTVCAVMGLGLGLIDF